MNIAKVRAVVEAAPALGRGWLVSKGTLSPVGTRCVLGELAHAMGVSDAALSLYNTRDIAEVVAEHGDYEATIEELAELQWVNDRPLWDCDHYDADCNPEPTVKDVMLAHLTRLVK